jgi:hypothetical protein
MSAPSYDFTRLDESAQRQVADQTAQRNAIGALYLNAIQTPLPKPDDPAYQAALQKREDLMKQYVGMLGPAQHASFAQHLHGLIFGQPDAAQPVHGNAPEPPQPAPQQPSAPPVEHPFAHNPVYAKIHEGLTALGNHLKAAGNPNPQPGPDYATLAAAPTEEERKNAAALELEKQKEASALAVAQARRPRDSVQKAQWDSEARALGYNGYDDPTIPADVAEKIAQNVKMANTTKTWKTVTDGGNIYAVDAHDPTKKTLIGKKDEVTETHYDVITQQANGDLVKTPMVRYTRKGSGDTVAELPSDTPTPPSSAEAPQVPQSANPGARPPGTKPAGGAKKVPVSKNAPHVVGHRDTAAETNDSKLTDAAQNALLDVQKAGGNDGKNLDPVGSQGIILAWLRGRVNRVTKAEIDQVNNLGGVVVRLEGDAMKYVSGTMTPQQYKWFLRSARDNYTNAKQVEDNRRGKTTPDDSQGGIKIQRDASGRIIGVS